MAYTLKTMYDKEHLLAYKKKDFLAIERDIAHFYVAVKVLTEKVSIRLTPVPVPPLILQALRGESPHTQSPSASADAVGDSQPLTE
jgi:hypothetical protein